MFWRPVISPTRRRRRRIAWTVAATLVAVVWVGSSQWHMVWVGNRLAVDMDSGAICVFWFRDGFGRSLRPGASFDWRPGYASLETERLEWWLARLTPRVETFTPGQRQWTLPLWMILLPMLVPTARAWRARTSPTLCPRCNYDRAGLAAGVVCPECGAAPLPPLQV